MALAFPDQPVRLGSRTAATALTLRLYPAGIRPCSHPVCTMNDCHATALPSRDASTFYDVDAGRPALPQRPVTTMHTDEQGRRLEHTALIQPGQPLRQVTTNPEARRARQMPCYGCRKIYDHMLTMMMCYLFLRFYVLDFCACLRLELSHSLGDQMRLQSNAHDKV